MAFDLAERHEDVRRLVWRHPTFRRALRDGYDGEDLMQEILVRLLVRQRGASQYDPERASFGRYIHVAVHGIIVNYRRDHPLDDMVDDPSTEEGQVPRSLVEGDTDLDVSVGPHQGDPISMGLARAVKELELDRLDRAILMRLAQGHLLKDIRAELRIPAQRPDRVQRLLDRLGRWGGLDGYGVDEVM